VDIKNQKRINELPDNRAIKDIKIELTFTKNLPSPLSVASRTDFAKEGDFLPLVKGG